MSVSTKSLLLLVLLPVVLGSPMDVLWSSPSLRGTGDVAEKRDNSFVWASIGDSWASGVSYYGSETDYDGDKYGCHRWKDSYGPKMERNTSWTTGTQTFHFAACSGARLSNMAYEPQGDNPRQMELVGSPQMITYHAGGNNCGFGSVISNCIYQPSMNDTEWQPEYPDPAGKCGQELQSSNNYINDPGDHGLYQDEMNTVNDVLRHDAVRDNKDFRLYILGYAHLFNTGDNWCNDISFAPRTWIRLPGPKVSNRRRTDINDGVERVNSILRRVVNDVGDSRVRFIDISPAFKGRRFCEDGHSYNDQWYSTDVWLWNLNLPINDPPADPGLMEAWLNGTQLLPDGTTIEAYFQDVEVGVEIQGDAGRDGGSGGSGGIEGSWRWRPFHPKHVGTQAIADMTISQAKEDKIPSVVGSSAPTTGTCDCNESGCSPESPACCADGTCWSAHAVGA